CQCVGIRILEPRGTMPYEAFVGFTNEFWESENCLSFIEDECACTRIVSGQPDTWDQPLLTSCGSIYTDDLQGFAQKVPEQFLHRYRGKCIGSEFATLSVIPIRYQAATVGLLHIADQRSDLLSTEDVLLLESLSNAIGEVIHKFNVNEALQQREAELKCLQNSLQQARKMETVGTMASAIAHDFNNLLSVIAGHLDIIASTPASKENPFEGSLEHIRSATGQAANLTRQLLAFSRKEDSELEPCAISDIVIEALRMLRPIIPASTKLVKQISAKSIVAVDVAQLHQVMANLFANAVYAMDGKGELKVTLKETELTPQDLRVKRGQNAGKYAVLSVSDTGCGIEIDTITKIFDAFFTTKPVGVGIGLGLSMIQGIVERHNGFISVESTVNEGTTFDLYFPVMGNNSRR
ncbi:MAG: ATP-binding protein, partial [Desulfuromonadales bacterium]|nr:ATP-binding protein [Desulfuromonadales bacterium]